MTGAHTYARIQRETASKERMLVMLFEAGLRHIRTGAQLLERGCPRDAITPLSKASDIVVELDATLDRTKAPELCDGLHDIYAFVTQKLMQAMVSQDAVLAREAERVFAPLVDGFAGAVASLGGGK
jgi:flagellar secretion chaperone FliS